MDSNRKIIWKIGKVVLGVAIVGFVGWRFVQDLGQLDLGQLAFRPLWILASAILYVAGQFFSGMFWHQLLHLFGAKPKLSSTLRAYYIAQLGKYIPGKALALLLRGIILFPEVRFGICTITAFYEVLTTMAAGALVAALLFMINPPQALVLEWNPVWIGLGLFLLVLIPLCPPIFNRVVRLMMRKLRGENDRQFPSVEIPLLLRGLLATSLGWSLLGLSLWALLQGILPEGQPWTWHLWSSYTAMVSLAYVAGFLALVVPSGVGVREYVLLQFLPIEIAAFTNQDSVAVAAMAILILRLVWTAAEVLVSGGLYFLVGGTAVSMKEVLEESMGKAKSPRKNENQITSTSNPIQK